MGHLGGSNLPHTFLSMQAILPIYHPTTIPQMKRYAPPKWGHNDRQSRIVPQVAGNFAIYLCLAVRDPKSGTVSSVYGMLTV